MDGAILVPEQHQRHMLALILQMDRRPVRLGDHCRDAGRRWEKQRIHIGVGQRVIKRPGQSGAGGTLQVVANLVRPSPRLSDISLNVRPLARSLRASLIFRIGNLFMGSSLSKKARDQPASGSLNRGRVRSDRLVRMRLEWLSG